MTLILTINFQKAKNIFNHISSNLKDTAEVRMPTDAQACHDAKKSKGNSIKNYDFRFIETKPFTDESKSNLIHASEKQKLLKPHTTSCLV